MPFGASATWLIKTCTLGSSTPEREASRLLFDTATPSSSFSHRHFSASLVGTAGTCRSKRGVGTLSPNMSNMEVWLEFLSRSSLWASDMMRSTSPSRPLRSPKASKAPALMRLSRDLRFTPLKSATRHMCSMDSNGPSFLRAAMTGSRAAPPTFFTDAIPKRIAGLPLSPASMENTSSPTRMSGGSTSILMRRHSFTALAILSVLALFALSNEAMYSTG